MTTPHEIISVNIGKPISIKKMSKEIKTGIFKFQINAPVYLGKLNFNGDGQADLVHHGGVEKAVCVYSYEHYPYWERELSCEIVYGAFGENLTVKGMLEKDVCIGDIYKLGEAVVQVSQPRQPCYKLAKRYNMADLPVRFQNTGYTGFYFRVLKEGWVPEHPSIELIQRHLKGVTIEFANKIMHHAKENIEGIHQILEVDELSSNWRQTFTNRLKGKEVDPRTRLDGR
ncbi:MOSC domain-containing protein [Ectobacillus panaciterrae]|uniref:MOSC domain-containing protein n=1 Tax=Ectobacillus panaciterrae TaxID=363872 RepID=UPI000406E856|nr:MOSC domain-containing protein [Ectobacillus panaciterrae]